MTQVKLPKICFTQVKLPKICFTQVKLPKICFTQIKLTKICFIGTLYKVQFKQGFGLFNVWFLLVSLYIAIKVMSIKVTHNIFFLKML